MLHVCVHIRLCPSNRAILGRALEHLGNAFPIWPYYGWDFEISTFRETKMSQITVFRTIADVSFRKGHFRPRRRTLEIQKTVLYDHFGAAVGSSIIPLGTGYPP